MVKERYVSFEIAKLLKKKGFDEPCRLFYKDPQAGLYEFKNIPKSYKDIPNNPCFFAPSFYVTMEWLREKGIYMYVEPFITISSEGYNLEGYKPWITTFKTNWFNPLSKIGTATYSKTYEEAVEVSIMFAIENLI